MKMAGISRAPLIAIPGNFRAPGGMHFPCPTRQASALPGTAPSSIKGRGDFHFSPDRGGDARVGLAPGGARPGPQKSPEAFALRAFQNLLQKNAQPPVTRIG